MHATHMRGYLVADDCIQCNKETNDDCSSLRVGLHMGTQDIIKSTHTTSVHIHACLHTPAQEVPSQRRMLQPIHLQDRQTMAEQQGALTTTKQRVYLVYRHAREAGRVPHPCVAMAQSHSHVFAHHTLSRVSEVSLCVTAARGLLFSKSVNAVLL